MSIVGLVICLPNYSRVFVGLVFCLDNIRLINKQYTINVQRTGKQQSNLAVSPTRSDLKPVRDSARSNQSTKASRPMICLTKWSQPSTSCSLLSPIYQSTQNLPHRSVRNNKSTKKSPLCACRKPCCSWYRCSGISLCLPVYRYSQLGYVSNHQKTHSIFGVGFLDI